MMDFLLSLQPWHWLILGLFVLMLELLGAGGFLLGLGIAALLVAALLALVPGLDWHWQFVCFAVLSVVASYWYWKRFRRFNEKTDKPMLNDRVQRLIGRRVLLLTAIAQGSGKVQIEDALWSVTAAQDLPAGTQVLITGAQGMRLQVEAVTEAVNHSAT